eukprot:scaffold24250_cov61-Attheya_sp.AAC.8
MGMNNAMLSNNIWCGESAIITPYELFLSSFPLYFPRDNHDEINSSELEEQQHKLLLDATGQQSEEAFFRDP